ncbi:MAG TPA: O-antigen ligase family protein [Gaiellaceae bacterium]|nr:O-antigen ligase family protein [Gaiellaceae bacterium]
MIARAQAFSVPLVFAGAGLVLAGGVAAYTLDPRLGVAALVAPVVAAFLLSPPTGTALLFFVLPLEELAAITGGLATKLLGLGVVGGWLLHALLWRESIGAPRISAPVVGFLLWAAASALWAVEPGTSLRLLATYGQLFGLYLLVANVLRTPAALRRALRAHAAGGAVLAALGLWLTWEGVLQQGRTAIVVDHQLLMEPNAFAAALILPVAICLVGTTDRERGATERLLLGVAGALCLTTLLLTMSRGAVVAIAATAMVVSVARGQVLLPVLALLLAVPGLLLAPAEFWQRWSEGATLADRGAGRLDIWKVGWVVIREHPLLGVGLGCFPIVYYGFLSQATGISWKHAASVAQVLVKYPHNIYVGAAAELGLVGLGLLVTVLAVHLWVAFDTWRRLRAAHHPATDLALTVFAALLALAIQGAAFDVAHRKYLWATLALATLGRHLVPAARMASAEPFRRAA